MAVLKSIPDGRELAVQPDRVFTFEPAGSSAAAFLVGRHRGRWILFDTGGATRVCGRAVDLGAHMLRDGDLISVPGVRLRFVIDDVADLPEVIDRSAVCSFCRDETGPAGGDDRDRPLRCARCGALVHAACWRVHPSCGRCEKPMKAPGTA